MSKSSPPEEIQRLLKTIYDDCLKEDTAVRERQIRNWRRLKLLWEGFQRVWFSEVAHDWRIWDETQGQNTDQSYYDKPINVFKAYLESIIAALSVSVPQVKCYPDDADNTLDLVTARAGDKIGQLIYRHNDAPLLWLHALFTSATESMVACYQYPKESEEYGTYDEKEYEDIEGEREVTTCSICGYEIDSNPITTQPNPIESIPPELNSQISGMGMQQSVPPKMTGTDLMETEKDEFNPSDEDAALHAELNQGQDICPACMAMMDPEIKREKFITTRLVGVTKHPKSRICQEIYGGLYVKVSNYAKKQEDATYLIFSQELDYSKVVQKYEHLHGNKKLISNIKSGDHAGSYTQYDQWGRLSPQYQGEFPLNVVTVNSAWIRPAKFNMLSKENADELKRLYPDGCKAVFINEEFAEACNQSLDDHWTLTENPLADYLYFEPSAQGLVSVQEITNDLISLVIQTLEHGIGQTFADPGVLDFKAYAQTEVTPGGVFPATPKSGKTLNDGFHELRTATLSAEVLPFSQTIQSYAQLVSGALPSLFGGSIEGSETASQYAMSRAQALQRQQNTWKVFTIWWKKIYSKAIPMYINLVKEDERDVQKGDDGNFINVMIRKAELEGKIGKIELESSENLPLTWAQRKDVIEKLLANGNPEIMKMFTAPENISLIHDAIGLVDWYVPGEDDIIKQYDEIKLLLNSTPIETGDPQVPEIPSVEIDPDFDNHAIEYEICRKWIISEVGRQTKLDNEPGYRNVLLHGRAHLAQMQMMQMQQMQQQAAMGQGAAPNAKPNPLDNEAPVTGDNDVKTQQ